MGDLGRHFETSPEMGVLGRHFENLAKWGFLVDTLKISQNGGFLVDILKISQNLVSWSTSGKSRNQVGLGPHFENLAKMVL